MQLEPEQKIEVFMNSRIGSLEDLPESIRKQLRQRHQSSSNLVIETIRHLDGVASVDEIIAFQYRLFKVMPKSRAQLTNLLCRMRGKKMLEHKSRGVWGLPSP
jgi:hypothetical protein